jgi:transposase-like protein
MAGKRHTAEQIIQALRQVEILIAEGASISEAVRHIGVTEQTYYRWRNEYGGMRIDQAKRLKELEQENSRLKHMVAEKDLDIRILREAMAFASKKSTAR